MQIKYKYFPSLKYCISFHRRVSELLRIFDHELDVANQLPDDIMGDAVTAACLSRGQLGEEGGGADLMIAGKTVIG